MSTSLPGKAVLVFSDYRELVRFVLQQGQEPRQHCLVDSNGCVCWVDHVEHILDRCDVSITVNGAGIRKPGRNRIRNVWESLWDRSNLRGS